MIITESVELATKTCPVCGVVYALPKIADDKRREGGGEWFCPNGHTLVYTEIEAAKYKRLYEQAEAQKKAAMVREVREQMERDQRHAAQEELQTSKAKTEKLQK